MKIYILTQEDAFYIPKLIDGLVNSLPPDVTISGASILEGEIAISNVPKYINLLGLKGTIYNGLDFVRHKFLDLTTNLFNWEGVYSVKGVFQRHEIPLYNFKEINTSTFYHHMQNNKYDLIVSLACPKIISRNLIEIPEYGCINLHGALLPKYRGKLPSFWVLLNNEKSTGVTVHMVNEELDDGPILMQKKVPIKKDDTMHSLILRSKIQYGTLALREAILALRDGNVSLQENNSEEATYFSFPDRKTIKKFKEKGNRVR